MSFGEKIRIPGLEASVKPVPAGVYRCRVEEFTRDTSKTGKAMWKVRLVLVEDGPYQGRNIFDNMVVEDEMGRPFSIGIRRLAAFLKAAGVRITDDSFMPEDALHAELLVRTDVEIDDTGETTRVKAYIAG